MAAGASCIPRQASLRTWLWSWNHTCGMLEALGLMNPPIMPGLITWYGE